MNDPWTSQLISILVPVYNTERYLRDCLDSISLQTYTNFEAIMVDDGSTDQSGTICDEYALKDERFKVIHQNNSGVTMARIAAFENCHGEYITFIDSDDYISSCYLETLLKPLLKDDADIVCCDIIRVKNKNTFINDSFVHGIFQGESLRNFICNDFIYDQRTKEYGMQPGLASKMIKRCLVEDGLIQGKDLWFGEDMISVFYMLLKCKKLVVLSDKMYNYVEHDDEAVFKYTIGLWDNNIKLLQRLEYICINEGITISYMRSRVWKFVSNTLFKMQLSGMSYILFRNDMSIIRNRPYMVKYFEPWMIDYEYGIIGNVGYLLLKLKRYRLLWLLENIKEYTHKVF